MQPLFADLIWERQAVDGSLRLVHSAYVCAADGVCAGGSSEWHAPHDSLSAALAASTIPPLDPTRHVRVSYGLGRLLPACTQHLQAMGTAAWGGWASASRLVFVQSMQWCAARLTSTHSRVAHTLAYCPFTVC